MIITPANYTTSLSNITISMSVAMFVNSIQQYEYTIYYVHNIEERKQQQQQKTVDLVQNCMKIHML